MAKATASKNSPGKKTPAKKGTPAKPVKRLGADKPEKPVVEARKSARNATTKNEDVTDTNAKDSKAQVIADAAKKVKVTKAKKLDKTAAKTPVAEKNDILDDSNADESIAEDPKPDPVAAQEELPSNGQPDESGAKIAKVQ